MAKSTLTDEVISVSDIVVAPRGRKAETDAELVSKFAGLAEGQAIRLGGKFGAVTDKADRQKVGATIRKNWKAARADECRINFGTDGVPQVSVKVAKADADA